MATKTTKKTTSSSSSNTVKFDAKTGKALTAGQTTTDAKGNTYTAGQSFSTPSSSSSSSSKSSSSSTPVIPLTTPAPVSSPTVSSSTPKTSTITSSLNQALIDPLKQIFSSTPKAPSTPSAPATPSIPSFATPASTTGITMGPALPSGTSSSSESVKALQRALNAKGANLKVDGILGPLTQAAEKQFSTNSSNGSNFSTQPAPQITDDRDEQGLLVNPPGAIYDRNTGLKIGETPKMPLDEEKKPVVPNLPPEAQKAVETAESAYKDSLEISPDELSTQEDLDKLIESTKKGYLATENQAIPMEFITGQLKSIEDRATNLAEPLERKLARLQAARTSSLEASKFALERADKKLTAEKDTLKPISGTSFYDPATGTFKQAPSTTAKASESFTLGAGENRYDASGNLIASGGAKPISDAQAVKNQEKVEAEEAKTQESLLTANLVNQLLQGKTDAIFGAGQFLPSLTGSATEVTQFDTLKAKLALGARELIKGSGAISDFEARTLQNASSVLSRKMSNEAGKNALIQIRGALMSNAGQPVNVKVTDPSTGRSVETTAVRDDIGKFISEGNIVEYV